MKKIKILICVFVTVILTAAFLHLCSLVLMPKYTGKLRDGGLIDDYYEEADNGRAHQVIFIGDCEVYETVVPPVLWEKYNITSFVRGSPGQTVAQSYYLLSETLKYEIPEAVVFNVYAMKHEHSQREEYNRMTLDGMRISEFWHGAVMSSLTEGEGAMSYYFPILRYHSRITEIKGEDFAYMFQSPTLSHNGYLMQKGVVPMQDGFEDVREEAMNRVYDPCLPTVSFEYLEKMRLLCEQNSVKLILMKSPTNSARYFWYDEWDREICEYSKEKGLDYYNFINRDMGIDWQHDTYDEGMHLNVYGAEKFTAYLGSTISVHLTRQNMGDEDIQIWENKLKNYYNDRGYSN